MTKRDPLNSDNPRIYFPAKITRSASRCEDLFQDLGPRVYGQQHHLEREHYLPDLLVDLMHWADKNGVAFDDALDTARGHYGAEKRGEF